MSTATSNASNMNVCSTNSSTYNRVHLTQQQHQQQQQQQQQQQDFKNPLLKAERSSSVGNFDSYPLSTYRGPSQQTHQTAQPSCASSNVAYHSSQRHLSPGMAQTELVHTENAGDYTAYGTSMKSRPLSSYQPFYDQQFVPQNQSSGLFPRSEPRSESYSNLGTVSPGARTSFAIEPPPTPALSGSYAMQGFGGLERSQSYPSYPDSPASLGTYIPSSANTPIPMIHTQPNYQAYDYQGSNHTYSLQHCQQEYYPAYQQEHPPPPLPTAQNYPSHHTSSPAMNVSYQHPVLPAINHAYMQSQEQNSHSSQAYGSDISRYQEEPRYQHETQAIYRSQRHPSRQHSTSYDPPAQPHRPLPLPTKHTPCTVPNEPIQSDLCIFCSRNVPVKDRRPEISDIVGRMQNAYKSLPIVFTCNKCYSQRLRNRENLKEVILKRQFQAWEQHGLRRYEITINHSEMNWNDATSTRQVEVYEGDFDQVIRVIDRASATERLHSRWIRLKPKLGDDKLAKSKKSPTSKTSGASKRFDVREVRKRAHRCRKKSKESDQDFDEQASMSDNGSGCSQSRERGSRQYSQVPGKHVYSMGVCESMNGDIVGVDSIHSHLGGLDDKAHRNASAEVSRWGSPEYKGSELYNARLHDMSDLAEINAPHESVGTLSLQPPLNGLNGHELPDPDI